MANVAISDVEAIVRRYYRKNKMMVIGKPRSPAFIDIMKNTQARGQYRLAALYSDGGGRSADFAAAQASHSATSKVAFDVSGTALSDDFAIAAVDNKTIRYQKDAATIAEILITESDAKIRKLVRSAQIGMYSADGSRSMGVVESVSGANLVLTEKYMVRRFTKGDQVVAGATATGALRDSGDFVTIASVDPSTRTLVSGSGDWTTVITGLAAGDTVFHRGDAANGSSVKGYFGFPAWIPDSAPTSTLFFNVDRTADTEKLGGIRFDGSTAGSIREALIGAAFEVFNATQGDADIKRCYLGIDEMERLVIELDDTKDRVEKKTTEFGYEMVSFTAGPYTLHCVADPENVTGRAYLIDPSTWELASLDEVPTIANLDGNKWLRQSASAGIEMRLEAYAQPACQAPGHNCSASLPAA